MRTERLRGEIHRFIGNNIRSTGEILEHLNQKYRHGSSMQQLVNVLGKSKSIVNVGREQSTGRGRAYPHSKWALRGEYDPEP